MERMLKRIAVKKDGTISMSEFRNLAEKYQGKIDKLEEEIEHLRRKQETLEETNQTLIRERDSKNSLLREENEGLIRELEQREKDFEEFKNAVKTIIRFI